MEFNKKVLDNGLSILHEKRDVPVTTVMLACRYGYSYEDEKEKGMAHFMEHLCFKGTEKRGVDDISGEIEGVGGAFNAFTHEEVTAYHVKLPSRHFEKAMDVLFDIYFNASFPEEEVLKEARVIAEEIKMRKDNAAIFAHDKIKQQLYGVPFGLDGAGTIEGVLSMKREQLFEKHRKMYAPKNTILTVVGNNSFEEVVGLAKKFVVERDGEKSLKKEVVLTNGEGFEKRRDISQVNVAFGIHFPNIKSNERYASEVFNSILGEGMSSKLFRELREKRGLVYGVRSSLDLGSRYGYMVIWAGTDTSKLDEVRKICKEEFSKMGSVSEEELGQAKIRLSGSRDVEMEDSSDVALGLIIEEMAGDGENYYKYLENVASVSLGDIYNLAKNSNFSEFWVGP